MNWLSFFTGVLVGWLIELIIDFVFWRRRRAKPTSVHAELAETEAKVGQLEAQLAACQDDVERLDRYERQFRECADALQRTQSRLAAAEAEVQNLQAALAEANLHLSERTSSFVAWRGFEPHDLQNIEGIGPKIAELLNAHGIYTFAELAETEVERLRQILQEAGPRYRLADPETWPAQARLAMKGDWAGLREFQSRLKGGRSKLL